MNDQELLKLLEHFHGEIEQIGTVDEKGQKLLQDLEKDIHELLKRSEDERLKSQPSMVSRLENTIDYLSINHPTLAITLSQLLSILSNAGI